MKSEKKFNFSFCSSLVAFGLYAVSDILNKKLWLNSFFEQIM
jgi:hypothetical protein